MANAIVARGGTTLPLVYALSDSRQKIAAIARLYFPIVLRSLRYHAPSVSDAVRSQMAIAMICHLGIEGSFAGQVWRWNVGNITPGFGWKGRVYIGGDTMPTYDASGKYTGNVPFTQQFRAYGSLEAGISDYVAFVRFHAPGAFASLKVDPLDYLGALRRSKYLGGFGETDDQFRGIMSGYYRLVDAASKSRQPSSPKRVAAGFALVLPAAALITMAAVL